MDNNTDENNRLIYYEGKFLTYGEIKQIILNKDRRNKKNKKNRNKNKRINSNYVEWAATPQKDSRARSQKGICK